MKTIYIVIASFFMAFSAYAGNVIDLAPLLNKVTLQLQAEQWVTTTTAIVYVNVNATVSDQGISNVQADVLDKLKKLSDKDVWHIVSFNRQQDQSGLESIQISAQARLPQTELAGLRDKAKAISKPGETFTISNVQFVPSEEEIRQANAVLRNNLYQQAKTEIDALNKMYPDQKYYLYSIDFTASTVMPSPNEMRVQSAAFVAASPALPVGDKTKVQAIVVIASLPENVIPK